MQQQQQQQPHWPPPLHLLQQLPQQDPQQQQQQQQQMLRLLGAPSKDQLGTDQLRALEQVMEGHCIFLTGGAGVGKSYTVAVVVDALRNSGRRVAVTASTGTAAVNVGGMTLHSFTGILDVTRHKVKLAEGLWQWSKFKNSWRGTDVLLVDEVSMVDCEVFEKVDYVARYLRGWRIPWPQLPGLQGLAEVHELHPEPFGGLQLIAVGDFFQLSPVAKQDNAVIDAGSPQRGTPTRGSGSSAGSAKKKGEAADDANDRVVPIVPVIMAALPPGFETFTAAERAAWSKAARTQVAAQAAANAAAARAAGAGSSGGRAAATAAAAAAAGGYPAMGALAGGDFSNPLLQRPPQQQAVGQHHTQHQQQQRAADATNRSPFKKACRPGSTKQEGSAAPNPAADQQPMQQHQQGAVRSQPSCSSNQQPAAATEAAAREAAALTSPYPCKCQRPLKEQQRQRQLLMQRMTEPLTPEQLRALGIPPTRQLPEAVIQQLESRVDLNLPLLQLSKDIGLQVLLQGEPETRSALNDGLHTATSGATSSSMVDAVAAAAAGSEGQEAAAAVAAETAAAAAVKAEAAEAVAEQEDMQDAEEWALVFEAEAAMQQQQQQQADTAAAAVAAAERPVLVHQQGPDRSDVAEAAAVPIAAGAAAATAVPLPGEAEELLPKQHVNTPAEAGPAAAAAVALAQSVSLRDVGMRAVDMRDDSTNSDTAPAPGYSSAAVPAAEELQDTSAAAAGAASGGLPAPAGLLRLSQGSCHSGLPVSPGPHAAAAAAAAAGADTAAAAEHEQAISQTGDADGVKPNAAALVAAAAAAAAEESSDWEIIDVLEPCAAAKKNVINLTDAPSDSDEVLIGLTGGCTDADYKMQQAAPYSAAAAAAAADGGAVAPAKLNQEQQQPHWVPAPLSALQLAAAAALTAAAAAPDTPGAETAKVLGRDLGYAESGSFPFWRVPSGCVYAGDNPLTPAPLPGSSRAAGQLPPGMATLRSGLTSGRTGGSGNAGSSGAGSGSAGRRGMPQWREAPWAKSYCFKSPAWAAAGLRPVVLRQPFRQNELQLLHMLDAVRQGLFTEQTRHMLASLQRPLAEDDGITPTELFPTNRQVDLENEKAYAKLAGPELKLRCIDRCRLADADRVADADPAMLPVHWVSEILDDSTNAQQHLKVKPQAQVVLLWNLDVPGGLANGTRGVVEGLASVRQFLQQEGLLPPGAANVGQQQQKAGWQQGCSHRSSSWPSQGQQERQQQQQHWCCGPGCWCMLPPWQQPAQAMQQQPEWQWLPQQQQQQQQQLPQHQHQHQQQQWGAPPQPPPTAGRLPRYSDHQLQTGCCGDPLCPCGMGCWGKQKPRQRRVRLPEAPEGVLINLPGSMPPWRRRQLQEALVWINHTGTLQLPLVKFARPPREAANPFATLRRLIVGPQTWTLERRVRVGDDSEKVRLMRTALPLRLAWALTVHRSQGMSLSKLKVHLGQAFGASMVYVCMYVTF